MSSKASGSIPVRATKKTSVYAGFEGYKSESAPISAPKKSRKSAFAVPQSNDKMKTLNTVYTYNAGGDASKRWYAIYYLQDINNPQKRTRVREYGGVNYVKDALLKQKALDDLVVEIHQAGRHISGPLPKRDKNAELTCAYLVKLYLYEKRAVNRHRAYETDEQLLNHFIRYLKTRAMDDLAPGFLDKTILHGYRMKRLASGVSNRTVNNHMLAIKTWMNWVHENFEEVFPVNWGKKMKPLPSSSEQHVAYTDEEARKISNHLKEHDPETLHFLQFIVYPFLRPNETIRVRVGDIDIENKKLLLPAIQSKTKQRTYKPIPEIFIEEIKKSGILYFPKEYFVFGRKGGPGLTPTTADKFRARFKKVKTLFGFSTKHTMYGLRHTFVCQLLRNGMSPMEVMKYTGHTTLDSFQKYARSVMQGEAIDISDKYSVKF